MMIMAFVQNSGAKSSLIIQVESIFAIKYGSIEVSILFDDTSISIFDNHRISYSSTILIMDLYNML